MLEGSCYSRSEHHKVWRERRELLGSFRGDLGELVSHNVCSYKICWTERPNWSYGRIRCSSLHCSGSNEEWRDCNSRKNSAAVAADSKDRGSVADKPYRTEKRSTPSLVVDGGGGVV